MAHRWKEDRAKTRIASEFEKVRDVEIRDYKRDTSLESIPSKRAYRVHGAHLYIDILNIDEMLGCTATEGETCHQRTLRFLNQHYRAVHRILDESDVVRVDFHNQRLHAVVTKPYGETEERARVARAVAVAQLVIDVLAETGDKDAHIENAKVRVGIDSGLALAVNNGRKGGREPLFLGSPANQAAKCAGHGKAEGIYLTNAARSILGFDELEGEKPKSTPLTRVQIDSCIEDAALGVSKERIINLWHDEQAESPIGEFEFSRPTPPLSDLDFKVLTPGNSRRFVGVSLYADIDGFTQFVDDHIDDKAEDLVRALHVLRSEMDAVVYSDFKGRRVRFVGDCLHGGLLEGISETDEEAVVSAATQCAGALRSSFALSLAHLQAEGVGTGELGLAIGYELGPLSFTRLGIKGSRVRCATGRAVLVSEDAQRGCKGNETAIGEAAYNAGSDAVRLMFSTDRKTQDLDYDAAVEELASSGDRVAKAAQEAFFEESAPAVVPALAAPFRPHTTA